MSYHFTSIKMAIIKKKKKIPENNQYCQGVGTLGEKLIAGGDVK